MSMEAQPPNPYAAPRADASADAEAEEAANLSPAGLGLRFLNYLIDSIVVAIVQTVFTFGLGMTEPYEDLIAKLLLVSLIVVFGYYIVLEGVWGITIGKLATGTRVVRFDGYKPHFPQIIGRTFARCIPFEPFSLLFSGAGTGWHDSLSGTRVVRVRR